MKVLVINCGSSSLKYQVIDSETEHVLAKGLCERIGIDGVLTYQPAGQDKIKYEAAMPAHRQAVELVLKQLTNPENGILKSIDEIDAVGHRMVLHTSIMKNMLFVVTVSMEPLTNMFL